MFHASAACPLTRTRTLLSLSLSLAIQLREAVKARRRALLCRKGVQTSKQEGKQMEK